MGGRSPNKFRRIVLSLISKHYLLFEAAEGETDKCNFFSLLHSSIGTDQDAPFIHGYCTYPRRRSYSSLSTKLCAFSTLTFIPAAELSQYLPFPFLDSRSITHFPALEPGLRVVRNFGPHRPTLEVDFPTRFRGLAHCLCEGGRGGNPRMVHPSEHYPVGNSCTGKQAYGVHHVSTSHRYDQWHDEVFCDHAGVAPARAPLVLAL